MADLKDQQHPQYAKDRATVNQIMAGEPGDHALAELGRLLIRYKAFPGARDIQTDLQKALNLWGLTEAELYAKTQVIHQTGTVYQNLGRNREDWS